MDNSTVIVIFSGATLVVAICCLLIAISRKNQDDDFRTNVATYLNQREERVQSITSALKEQQGIASKESQVQKTSEEKLQPTQSKPQKFKNRGAKTAVVYKIILPNGEYTIGYATGKQAKHNMEHKKIHDAIAKRLQECNYSESDIKHEIIKQDFKSAQECHDYKNHLIQDVVCNDPLYIGRRTSLGETVTKQSETPQFQPKKQNSFIGFVYKRILPNGEYTINMATGPGRHNNFLPTSCEQHFVKYLKNNGYTPKQLKIEILKDDFKNREECVAYKNELVEQFKDDPDFLHVPKGQRYYRTRENKSVVTPTPSYSSSKPKNHGVNTMIVYKNILPDGKYTINMATGLQAVNSFYNNCSSVMTTYMEKHGYTPSQIKHVVIKQDFDTKEDCVAHKNKLVDIARQDPNFLCAKETPLVKKEAPVAPKHAPKRPKHSEDCKKKIAVLTLPDGKFFIAVTEKRLKDTKISSRAYTAWNYMKEHNYTCKDLKRKFLYTSKDYKNKSEYLELREQVLRRCANDPNCLNQINVCPECGSVNRHKKNCSKFRR